MNSFNSSVNEIPTFLTKSSHQEFSNRQRTLFDQLAIAEKSTKSTLDDSSYVKPYERNEYVNKIKRNETKNFLGKESIFKRPELPLSKCLPLRRMPDYQKNPHKWTKYSLEDVKNEDMSEKGNVAAALAFLKEMEQRQKTELSSVSENVPSKVVFKKNTCSLRTQNQDGASGEEKPAFLNSKVVMPEYVVGQKIKKGKKRMQNKSVDPQKQLKLDHLLEDDV